MAWLWQRDIDDEKRTPGLIFRLKSSFSRKNVSLGRAEKDLLGLGVKPGSTVLDFGCGPGQYSIAAARVVGDAGSVQALDLHPTALDMVETKAANLSLSNIETIYSELHTGLDDESVDTVLLFDVLRGRRDIRSLMSELHRILKPEGVLHVRGSGFKGSRLQELMVKDGLFRLLGVQGKVLNFAKVVGEFHEI
jgi:ubiquinone/menaquinone biosynthesis C-methylase UbiE